MARRPSDSDTSQQEQDRAETGTEKKKGRKQTQKQERVKQERRVASQDNDEDASDGGTVDEGRHEDEERDGREEDSEEEEGRSPKGRKRARVEEEQEEEQRRKVIPKQLERDQDGYITGSIVRVKLHQFLTYDDVEFRPGPYLNMVLGPNGTGKSSIACALCLGLNCPPSVLGRASDVMAFVKIGFEEASVELELKGPIGHPNIIIKREITIGPNPKKAGDKKATSTWTVNNEAVSSRKVTEVVQALGIQVNNLCSFLPQDKVAQFAHMSPQELLVATEKAAGDERLHEWHTKLIQYGKELKIARNNLEGESNQLQTAEQRNALLEKEVEQYRRRRQIEREIELYEVILPVREYQMLNEQLKVLKKQKDNLHARVLELQEKNKPVELLKARLEQEEKESVRERDHRKRIAQEKFKILKNKWNENNELDDVCDEIANKLAALKDEERKRKETIEKLTKEIHTLENHIAHPPEIEDVDVIEADSRANTERYVRLKRKKDELVDVIRTHADESARHKATADHAEQELQALNNIAHRKLESLRQSDPDIAQVVGWLRQNQHRFRMEILEPPMLSVTVPDKRYAAAVEAGFGFNQFRMFVAQCQEDQDLFNRLVMDSDEALGRRVIVNCWYRAPGNIAPPPLSEDELRQLGFDKYAIDCIEYPEGLRYFLLRDVNLHRFPIALDQTRVDQSRAMEMMSRIGPNGEGGGGSYVIGRVLNRVQRSRYGRRLAQNMTSNLGEARIFASHQVDQNKKREIEMRLNEAKTLHAEIEQEVQKIDSDIRSVEDELRVIQDEKKAIEARRRKVQETLRRLEQMKHQLERKASALEKAKQAPSVEKERQELRKKIFDIAKKRASIAKQIQALIRATIDETANATRAGLRFLQISANKSALEELVRARNAEYDEVRGAYETAADDYRRQREKTKEKMRLAQEMHENIDSELRETMQKMEEEGQIASRSVDEYRELIDNLRAQLELNLATNAGVIEQYERRQREIEERRSKVSNMEQQLATLERKAQKTRDKWYPALNALVTEIGQKFSRAFESVNCAGEIHLSEHEEYDKWAIDILVSFRATDKLQLLTGQRQSGGERALTTIMYLMSLVEMARTPFSLVDEINQGMDAQYERAVHNSLVNATCRPESGQYFLITPKLLTDLMYHERMKVLCVSNGEWLPEDNYSGNMSKMLEKYIAKRRNVSQSSH